MTRTKLGELSLPLSALLLFAGAPFPAAAQAQGNSGCQRLVEAFSGTFPRGTRTRTVKLPTAKGEWFLTVTGGAADVWVGNQRVIDRRDFHAGQPGLRAKVQVQRSTRLRVRVRGRRLRPTVTLSGVVPESEVGTSVGKRVAKVQLFKRTVRGAFPIFYVLRVDATPGGSEGLATVTATRGGRPLLGFMIYDGRFAVSPAQLRNESTTGAPIPVKRASGLIGWWARRGRDLEIEGTAYVVDQLAPTLAWQQPAAGATVSSSDPIELSFSDSGVGVDPASLVIELNGQDVTSSFTVSGGTATTTAGALRPQSGANTLVAKVRDKACNSTQAGLSFKFGPSTAPPTISVPGTLVVDAQGATTPVQFTVRASDPSDPNPTLSASPASGSSFGLGDTTVTVTATNSSGASASSTFTVRVVDREAPALAGAGAGGFGSRVSRTLGDDPGALAAGDLDGDGDSDVVAAQAAGGRVQVMLNAGGALGAPTAYTVGTNPSALALGDLDGDGDLDLVVANRGSNTVSRFLGDGAGAFGSRSDVTTGSTPSGVVLADVDGDGDLDLAASEEGVDRVCLALNDGSGNFAAPTPLATGAAPGAIAALDVDRDGDLDLLTVSRTQAQVSLLDNDGSGGFAAPQNFAAGSDPRALVGGDCNRDGWPDLLVANTGEGSVSFLAGSGSGFQAQTKLTVGGGPLAIVAADMNTDGVPDAVVANNQAGSLSLLLATPGQTNAFAVSSLPAPAAPAGLASADLDGDGRGDLLISGTVTDVVEVMPAANGLSDLTLEASGPGGAPATFAASASDAVDASPSLTVSPASGSTFALGSNQVSLSASDASGNQSQADFSVTVVDTTAPTIGSAPDLTVEQQSAAGAVVTYAAPTATDLVDGAVNVVCTPASGATFAPGATTVTCTATDAAGNSASVTFTVTVSDTTAPAISGATDLTLEQNGPTGTIVSYPLPSASDAVDPNPSVTCTPPPGTLFGAGPHTVTCTATDAAGNSATAQFTITIVDTTPPVLSGVPANITVPATSPAGAVVTYTAPTASDVVDPTPTVTSTPASGSTFAVGTTTVTCTATDAAGNSASRTFTVTVSDSTGPSFTFSPVTGSSLNAPAGYFNVVITADDPSGVNLGSFSASLDGVNVTSSFSVSAGTGGSLRAVATLQGTDGSRTISATVSDSLGNSSTDSTTFTLVVVPDTTPPTLTFARPTANQCLTTGGSIQIDYSDTGSGVRLTSLSLTLNGIALFFPPGASSSTIPLSSAPAGALLEGSNTLEAQILDNAGNPSGLQTVTFMYDTTGPTVSASPTGLVSLSPTLTVDYSDPCGVDPASFQATLTPQGGTSSDVSSAFTAGSNSASGALSLGEGSYTLEIRVSDTVGNQTAISETLEAVGAPTSIEITISPASPSSVEIATPNDLGLRLLTAQGNTARRFVGSVNMSVSDNSEPLQDLVVDFLAGDEGQKSVSGVAFFTSYPSVTVNATTLGGSPVTGSLSVTTTVSAPVIYPNPADADAAGDVAVAGFSFPGRPVELFVDGAATPAATVTATSGATFSATVNVGPGSHTIVARASATAGGTVLGSNQVTVQGPAAGRPSPSLGGAAQEPTRDGEDADAAAVFAVELGVDLDVLLHSGELRLDRVDLHVPGRNGLDFTLRRRYRSRLNYDGPLGHGWDFTYNEQLFVQGNGDVVRLDGRGHTDTWTSQGGGAFSAPAGYFGTLTLEGNGDYLLRETDGLRRRYASNGRLLSLTDRFGNALSLGYDTQNRLVSVTDVFGRVYAIAYQAVGGRDRISSITDFSGRTVSYLYSAGGDLRAVTTPPAASGGGATASRTEVYDYLAGQAQPARDHNLVAIARPAQVGPVSNATTAAQVVRVIYGSAGLTLDRVTGLDLFDAGAAPGATPTPSSGFSFSYGQSGSLLQVTSTAANGNQRYHEINASQHLVRLAEIRGAALNLASDWVTASTYTSDGQLLTRTLPRGNRITRSYGSGSRAAARNLLSDAIGPGTSADLVTRFTYEPVFNQRLTRTDPKGQVTTWVYDYQEASNPQIPDVAKYGISLAVSGLTVGQGDLNQDGRTDQVAGGLVRRIDPAVGSQQRITDFQRNDRGQLTGTIDPNGSLTRRTYFAENDPDGDGTAVAGQTSTLARGYLRDETVDASYTPAAARPRVSSAGFAALATSFGYDPLGRLTRRTDARGIATTYAYNSVGELLQESRGGVTTASVYDANGRLTSRTRASGTSAASLTSFGYDIYDRLTSRTQDVNGTKSLTTSYAYDPGTSNVTLLTLPRGNQISSSYDERDLLASRTEGAGSTVAGTVRFQYDGNGNLSRYEDAHSSSGGAGGDVTLFTYDDYDRLTRTRTPTSTTIDVAYDGNGNTIRETISGTTTVSSAGVATTGVLSDTFFSYDAADRLSDRRALVFLANGTSIASGSTAPASYTAPSGLPPVSATAPASDGVVHTQFEYDAAGNLSRRVEDGGSAWTFSYDGAGRLTRETGPLSDTRTFAYDGNGNLIQESVTESSGLSTSETYDTFFDYDDRDRLTLRVERGPGATTGHAWRRSYDARDNLTGTSDANSAALTATATINGTSLTFNQAGDSATFSYDLADRLTREERGGLSRTDYSYDDNGNLTRVVDDSGRGQTPQAATVFVYDAQDRLTRRTTPAGNATAYSYDEDDNLCQVVDPVGNTIAINHDAGNRTSSVDVTPPGGTARTGVEVFQYDGLDRLVRGTSDDGTRKVEVETIYDSLGRRLEERFTDTSFPSFTFPVLPEAVTHERRDDGRITRTRYPDMFVTNTGLFTANRLNVYNEYDALGRLSRVRTEVNAGSGPTTAADFSYGGPGLRELTRSYGNTATQVTSYDARRRLSRVTTTIPTFGTPATAVVLDREYAYDRADRITRETRRDDGGLYDSYSYDALGRLTRARFDVNRASGTPRAGLPDTRTFTYNGVGSRAAVNDDGTVTSYSVDVDQEYTSVGGASLTHDANGNVTNDGTYVYTYDFRNRVVQVDDQGGTKLVELTYYPDGRLAARKFFASTLTGILGPPLAEKFLYDGQRLLQIEDEFNEDRGFSRYVYGPLGDNDVLRVEFDANDENGITLPTREEQRWVHRDGRGNVAVESALVDTFKSQVVVDLLYDAFGVSSASFGITRAAEPPERQFQGHQLRHWRLGITQIGQRIYSPALGRFLDRGESSFVAPSYVPNVYDPAGANPVSRQITSDGRGAQARSSFLPPRR